jgi:GH15 family glucan-1,4-alpha-glucosidase
MTGDALPPIADYAVIGDCHTAALVSRRGAIDWCCLPRFDSASAFGRLLHPGAGTCVVEPDDDDTAQGEPPAREYLDGTLVLASTLRVAGGQARLYDCFAMGEHGRRGDERRRLLRVIEGERGAVPVRMLVQPRFDYGEVAPWIRHHGADLYSAVGGDDGLLCWSDAGLAPDDDHGLRGYAVVRAGQRVRLVLEFRRPETLDGDRVGAPTAAEADEQLDAAVAWWRAWSARSDFGGPDAAGVRRSALVLKALTYAPTGAMVAAATTSLPETPDGERTWDYRYSWIRDAVMSTRSLVHLGFEAEADAFRRFIERSAAGSADQLQVFYGVGGERRLPEAELGHLDGVRGAGPIRVGNAAAGQLQLDAYGHLVEQSWRWFQRGHAPDDDYWRFLVELVDCAAQRWSEPDRGIWEWRGDPRHFVHSKALCWAALDHGITLARECMRRAPEQRWRKARRAVREAVERDGFDEDRGTFVQAFGHRDLDAALLRLPAVGLLEYDDPRMVGTVDAVREELEDDGLLRRYTLDDGLPGREGAFLACTFWLAECLGRQGRVEEARRAFDRAIATANDLGLFAEEFSPEDGVMLGNFPQALTHLSHIEAAVALAGIATEPVAA